MWRGSGADGTPGASTGQQPGGDDSSCRPQPLEGPKLSPWERLGAVMARGPEPGALDTGPAASAGTASFRGAQEREEGPVVRATDLEKPRAMSAPQPSSRRGGRDASARRIHRGPRVRRRLRLLGSRPRAREEGVVAAVPRGARDNGVRGERGNLVLSGPGTAEGTAGRGWGPHGAETPPQKPRRRANTWKTV